MPETHAIPLFPTPDLGHSERVLLFAVRRMATGGLQDAHAAQAFIGLFGLSYRRPLVLLRAMMAELARASARRITVAPCCCLKVTPAEAALLGAIATAPADIDAAHRAFSLVLGTRDCLGAVLTGQALGEAFADLGRPMAGFASAE